MSTFIINKIGKNVQIIEQGEIYKEYYEDSANVEITYNTYSNRVSINIKGTTILTTLNITEGGYLFMAGVEVVDYEGFLTQYALVFPNGGGGPVTTPTLQEVLNEGNSADVVNGVANIQLSDSVNGNNTYLNPTGVIASNSFSGISAQVASDFVRVGNITDGREIQGNINNMEHYIKNSSQKNSLKTDGFKFEDFINSKIYNVNFPINSMNNVKYPNDTGVLQLQKIRKANYEINIATGSLRCFLIQYQNYKITTFGTGSCSNLATGIYRLTLPADFNPFAVKPCIQVSLGGTGFDGQYDVLFDYNSYSIPGFLNVYIKLYKNNSLINLVQGLQTDFQFFNVSYEISTFGIAD